MGWFNKKENKVEKEVTPSLPELPKLPEFPKIEERKVKNSEKPIYQLPSFPTNSFGEKFSQDAIKEAVTGKKEGEEVFETDEFAPGEDEMRMMQKPLKKPLTKELTFSKKRKVPEEFKVAIKKTEPIFIRIDKFEEGLKVFEKTKEKISEMEKMLKNIKRIKEEEEEELETWENEIQIIKRQIEKVDKDIFSKIE